MEITKELYKEILEIQGVTYNEKSRWFSESLANINQALQLHKTNVSGSVFMLGDSVYYPADLAPFKIVGIREHELEIEGDFSGGTHKVIQKDWIPIEEIKHYDKTKVIYYIDGKPFKNGVPLVW